MARFAHLGSLALVSVLGCTVERPIGVNDDASVADTPDVPLVPTDSPSSFGLTVTRSGCGVGSVSSTPAGITCGDTCTARFAPGTAVTLEASASRGRFTGWSGACTGSECVLPMTADRTTIARFSDVRWARQWLASTAGEPTGNSTRLRAAALDAAGNVVVGGYYDDELVLDGAMRCPDLPGAPNIFLTSLDSEGRVRWARCFGGPSNAEVGDIAIDRTSGDILVAGFHGNLESDGTPASLDLGAGPFRCADEPMENAQFVARFDAAGTLRWARGFCRGGGFAPSVALTPSGDVVFGRTLSFRVGDLYTTGGEVMLLAGADGTTRWTRTIDGGAPAQSSLSTIAVAASTTSVFASASLTIGVVGGSADFGTGPISPRTVGSGILSLAIQGTAVAAYALTDGAPQWVEMLDGAPDPALGSVVAGDELLIDAEGHPIISGAYFFSAPDVGGTTLPAGSSDPSLGLNQFVASLSASDGSHRWSHALTCTVAGSATGYGGSAMDRDEATGELVWVGGLEGSCSWGADALTARGARDAFAVRIAGSGAAGTITTLSQPPAAPGTIVEWEALAVEGDRGVLAGILRGEVDRCGESFVSPEGVSETILLLDSATLTGAP